MKNRTMKRILSLSMTVFLSGALLAGCGGNENSASSGASASSANNQESKPAGETQSKASEQAGNQEDKKADPLGKYDKEIVITTVRAMDGSLELDPNDPIKKSYEENIWTDTYLEKLNIKLEYLWIATDREAFTSKMNTSMVSGAIPDVVSVGNGLFGTLLEAGLAADMTDVYEQYGGDEYKSQITPEMYNKLVMDGKLMGLPISKQAYHGTRLLGIREDWLKKLNLTVPETTKDMETVLQAFVDNKLGGDGTIGLSLAGIPREYLNAFGGYPGYWVDDGKGGLVYGTILDGNKDGLLSLQNLYKKGLINKDFASIDGGVAEEQYLAGKAGMYYKEGWGYAWSMAGEPLRSNAPDAQTVPVMQPSGNGSPSRICTNGPDPSILFISKNCKNPEAAAKMINLEIKLTTEDYNTYRTNQGTMVSKFMIHGEEPVAPTWPFEQMLAIKKAVETGDTNFTHPAFEGRYKNFYLVNQEKNWKYSGFDPDGAFDILYEAFKNNRLVVNKFTGLPTETQKLMGDTINDPLNTAMVEVVMGKDISVFEEAVKQWKANGGDKITEEVNAWYKSVNQK